MNKVNKMVLMVLTLMILSALTTVALAEDVAFIPATSYEKHQSIAIEENFTIAPANDSTLAPSNSTKNAKARSTTNAKHSVDMEIIPSIIPEIAAEPEATARSVDMYDLDSLQASLGLGSANTIEIEELEIPLSFSLEGMIVKIFSDVQVPSDGQLVTLNSFVAGGDNLHYQWQQNVGNGEWLNILNANANWYSFKYSESMSGYSWRLVVDTIPA